MHGDNNTKKHVLCFVKYAAERSLMLSRAKSEKTKALPEATV
jgi:hypothetical protein